MLCVQIVTLPGSQALRKLHILPSLGAAWVLLWCPYALEMHAYPYCVLPVSSAHDTCCILTLGLESWHCL